MAQESEEAVAYLKALKQPYGSHAGTAAAPALEKIAAAAAAATVVGGTDHHYPGTEKRRSSRYTCEGSVEIQEDGVTSAPGLHSPTSACMAVTSRPMPPIQWGRLCT